MSRSLLTIADDIATVRLDRPGQGNALDLGSARRLRAAVDVLHGRPGLRAVLLAADGPQFCTGGDVREMAGATDREAFVGELANTMHAALVSLRALPVPIVAAVQGTVAGAGIGLVLAADIVIASDEVRFLAAYGEVGLSPDCGVSALLAAAVGPRRASLFVLTDLVLDARTATEWGLVTECCPSGRLNTRIDAVLARLARRPAAARGAAALLMRRGMTRDYATQLADEAASIARLSATAEGTVLLDAFAHPEPGESL